MSFRRSDTHKRGTSLRLDTTSSLRPDEVEEVEKGGRWRMEERKECEVVDNWMGLPSEMGIGE